MYGMNIKDFTDTKMTMINVIITVSIQETFGILWLFFLIQPIEINAFSNI